MKTMKKRKPDIWIKWSRLHRDIEYNWADGSKSAAIELMLKIDKSLQELKDLGYDLTTIKFSISKIKDNDSNKA